MKNLVPKSVSRLASRSALKISANSPTILVVTGVVGLGVTAVMAAKATRKIDPIIEQHKKDRAEIGYVVKHDKVVRREQQTAIVEMYYNTSVSLLRVYGPTIAVGTLSAASVLCGHKILKGRHVATMAAYSGLQEQFNSYRQRVAKTLGETAEKDIYDGAHGEWVEDPDHKGEYKLQPKFDEDVLAHLRPWFDETCDNWRPDPHSNYLFLKGVQSHANDLLQRRGHIFLSEILDDLRVPRTPESIVSGWVYRPNDPEWTGDNFVDFGFMTSNDPNTVAFREEQVASVQLNFNVDGVVYNFI